MFIIPRQNALSALFLHLREFLSDKKKEYDSNLVIVGGKLSMTTMQLFDNKLLISLKFGEC